MTAKALLQLDSIEVEARAMREVAEALNGLTPEGAMRVCSYVIDRMKNRREVSVTESLMDEIMKDAKKKATGNNPFGFGPSPGPMGPEPAYTV